MIGSFRDQDVGGAVVKRMFGGRKAGDTLTRAEVLAIPGANRAALINLGKIAVFPIRSGTTGTVPLAASEEQRPEIEHMKRHVVSRGFGKYDVIEGNILNAEPLTKDAAKALAGEPAEAESATH